MSDMDSSYFDQGFAVCQSETCPPSATSSASIGRFRDQGSRGRCEEKILVTGCDRCIPPFKKVYLPTHGSALLGLEVRTVSHSYI